MKSTRLFIAGAAAALALGCIPDRGSIEFLGTGIPALDDEKCSWSGSTTAETLGGSINLAVTTAYWTVLKVVNNLPATNVASGDNEIAGKQRHDFYVREMEVSYTCRDSPARCTGFTPPATAVVPVATVVQAAGTSNILLDMLTYDAAQALVNWGPTEPVQIVVGIRLRGTLMSGASKETDVYEFPLTVSDIPWTPLCMDGEQLTAVDCLLGQDGIYAYTCETTTP